MCADYSCTLNKALEDVIRPLPRSEELFAELNGGKYFTQLDVKSAYLQMRVDENSSLLQTINTYKRIYECNSLMYDIKLRLQSGKGFWKTLKKIFLVCAFFMTTLMLLEKTIPFI